VTTQSPNGLSSGLKLMLAIVGAVLLVIGIYRYVAG
jgi:hypothetical protein